MSFTKKCGPCSDDGWINDRKDICPVCNGVGHLRLDGEADDWVKCGPCSGDGWVNNRHDICQACGGCGRLLRP